MDRFENYANSLVSPACDGAEVAPSDGADLTQITRAIYVGEGGDLSLIFASGTPVTLRAVPGGTVLPLRATRVRATGTTATAIVALW